MILLTIRAMKGQVPKIFYCFMLRRCTLFHYLNTSKSRIEWSLGARTNTPTLSSSSLPSLPKSPFNLTLQWAGPHLRIQPTSERKQYLWSVVGRHNLYGKILFSVGGWLNPQVRNPQIQGADCIYWKNRIHI